MQRASAIGRVFWDKLIAELTDDPSQLSQVAAALQGLRERELIFHRERSGIAGSEEFIFKHNLLRDVTYETVLLRQRRSYHARIAAWMETNTGERQGEYLASIAEHYEHSNQPHLAADRYLRAGQRAKIQGATREAHRLFDRCLALLPEDDLERRWQALFGRDETDLTLGEVQARQQDDQALLALAEQMGDDWRIAEAWSHIAYTAHNHGDDRLALEAYEQALQFAERAGDQRVQALTLPLKIVSLVRLRRLEEAAALAQTALDSARQLDDPEILARALTNVSLYYMAAGDMTCASHLIDEQVDINHHQGNHLGEAFGLVNLGFNYIGLGRYEEARKALEQSARLASSLGARHLYAYNQLNLGLVYWRSGDQAQARAILQQSQESLQALGDEMGLASCHSYLGLALEAAGELDAAAAEFTLASQSFENMGQSGYAADAWAGTARCQQKSGALANALQTAGQLWGLLEEQGSQGLELPILAYLTCADIFQASGQPEKARQALDQARQELTARAELLSDEAWRQVFLENIPEHRRLMHAV
jgi:tetratricopeptide (TPR) repeat protein